MENICAESCQWGGAGAGGGNASAISKQLRGSVRNAHREVVMCPLSVRAQLKSLQRRSCFPLISPGPRSGELVGHVLCF